MSRRRLLVVMALGALLNEHAPAQSRPDFSGTWTLIDAQAGQGRGGGASRGERRPAFSIVSDAAVNCGTECTIVHTDATLTISRPRGRNDVKPPDVVLNLDGRETPGSVQVKWEGAKLVVTRAIGGLLRITQTISLQDGSLRVVSEFSTGDLPPAVLTYRRK